MATRGSYTCMCITIYSRIFGGIPKMQFSQKIDGFRQTDSQVFYFLELIKLYKQNPFEKIFIFTIYQNYTLALKASQ